MILSTKWIGVTGLAIALIALDGCSGKIRYPSYYALNVPAPPAAIGSGSAGGANPILGSVAVREFSAPESLRSGKIVYRQSLVEVDFYDYHRWADDPRRVVTAAMVREMQARGVFQSVDLFDGRGSPECLLTGSLDHLEEVDHGAEVSIEVGVSARLIDLRTGAVLWHSAASKTTRLDRRSVPGIVAEMSRDLGSAVEQLVSSMQDRLSASASAPSGSHIER